MDSGVESIADEGARHRLQAQARELKVQSAVIALTLLVVLLILPS